MNIEKDILIEEILNNNPYRIVVSNPRSKTATNYKKVVIQKKVIGKNEIYQIENYTQTQVFHKNIEDSELKSELTGLLDGEYKQVNAFFEGEEFDIKLNKDSKCYLKKNVSAVKIQPISNNRVKNYILKEGDNIPVFVELGIFTSEYKIVNSMYDKFKQINRFAEIVDDVLKTYNKESINIIDFGCGKSYLTFVLYYYLVEIKKINANIIGLDLKADVIRKCNELAKKFGYEGLRFEVGNINGYKAPFDVNMVVTLHACDTATDFALFNAINWNADIILSVPCCQHELNKQIESEELSGLLKFGILKERCAALVTDAIRGCLLEYKGYKTDIMEFIDIAHSPKNLLIRARKANISKEKKISSYNEALSMTKEFGCNQMLLSMLNEQDK